MKAYWRDRLYAPACCIVQSLSGLQQLDPPQPQLTIDEQLVTSILSKVTPHKTSGPDGLRGRVLEECYTQLRGVFTKMFQCLLDSGCIPRQWKESNIIPIPKKRHGKDLNDCRLVALISVLCKYIDKVVCGHLPSMLAEGLDPLQFVARHLDSAHSLEFI